MHLLCIVVDAIGERVMRYGTSLLQTIVPVLEANNRGGNRATAREDLDQEQDEEEEEEEENELEQEENEGGNTGGEVNESAIVEETTAGPSSDGAVPEQEQAHESWLHQGIFGAESRAGTTDDSGSWQVLYFAVFAFEKLESNCPALLREAVAAPLTRLMCGSTALLHSHPWVRQSCLCFECIYLQRTFVRNFLASGVNVLNRHICSVGFSFNLACRLELPLRGLWAHALPTR